LPGILEKNCIQAGISDFKFQSFQRVIKPLSWHENCTSDYGLFCKREIDMTITGASSGVTGSSLQALFGPKVAKTSDDLMKRLQDLKEQADAAPSGPITNPAVYATVKVDGKTVATLYEDGSSVTGNDTYGQLKDLPSMGKGETLVGPALAQKRADEIAKQLGGTVEKSPLVISQGMSDASAKTKTDAQIIAQKSGLTTDDGDSKTTVGGSAVDKFMAFMDSAKDGPAAFWRAQFLASQGLTEQDVAGMSPEEKTKLEDKIKTFIEQKMEEAKHQPTKDKTEETAKVQTGNDESAKSGLAATDAKGKSVKGPFSPDDLFNINDKDQGRRHNDVEDIV
jgi:hypothetical protein